MKPRKDLIVIGVGNTLREDDGVGIVLLKRLKEHFGSDLKCIEAYGPDISFAEEIAEFDNLLLIDALPVEGEVEEEIESAETNEERSAFKLIPIKSEEGFQSAGFTTHLCDWGEILLLAAELHNDAPKTELLGVYSYNFGISEEMSPQCKANAEKAFQFLMNYTCAKHS
ncbi:MAG: hydrogenase maturation protease [bacterium]|nr:hydrogenase maturation protease [bacterium]